MIHFQYWYFICYIYIHWTDKNGFQRKLIFILDCLKNVFCLIGIIGNSVSYGSRRFVRFACFENWQANIKIVIAWYIVHAIISSWTRLSELFVAREMSLMSCKTNSWKRKTNLRYNTYLYCVCILVSYIKIYHC